MSQNSGSPSRRPGKILRQTLESLEQAGLTHLPRPKNRPTASKAAAAATLVTTTAETAKKVATLTPLALSPATPVPASPPADVSAAGGGTRIERLAALEIVRADVAACTRCTELARTRTQTVFGVGNPETRLVFMGEAPGADEDRQGEPFVGRGGQLLNKIIEACTLKREEIYILNTIKCRPPENRNPAPQEAANCREYLDRQLEIIRPEFICCLGAVAAQNLLNTTTSIGKLRGRFHDYLGMRVLCTYHPAYLLRNPSSKKDCWDDMQILMREMGIKLKS
ncbi:MAG TPA: uracil-DNA glycosylase [Pirellulales bacterium]|jgi:DNA polymerase